MKVHRYEDSKYDINWVVDNHSTVFINREYKERHGPTYSGVSIVVPCPTDEGWLMEYAANEEGWMYVSDFKQRGRAFASVPTLQGIHEVESNVAQIVAAMRITTC